MLLRRSKDNVLYYVTVTEVARSRTRMVSSCDLDNAALYVVTVNDMISCLERIKDILATFLSGQTKFTLIARERFRVVDLIKATE